MMVLGMGVCMQLAVHRQLAHLFGTRDFPAPIALPFQPAVAWKLFSYQYSAYKVPPGDKSLLMFLTVKGQTLAVAVSQNMVVTALQVPTLPQSLFKGSVFEGHFDLAHADPCFSVTDCLAFKGHSYTGHSLEQRMAGITFLQWALADEEGQVPHAPCVCITFVDRVAVGSASLPNEGTWKLCPVDRGAPAGRVQGDTYVVALGNIFGWLPSVPVPA